MREGKGDGLCARMNCLFILYGKRRIVGSSKMLAGNMLCVKLMNFFRDVTWYWRARREFRNWALCREWPAGD